MLRQGPSGKESVGQAHNSQWYEDNIPSAQAKVEERLTRFVKLLCGSTRVTHGAGGPTFHEPTITLDYTADETGDYHLEGGMLGQHTAGVIFHVNMSFYLPEQTNAVWEESAFGSPPANISFSDSGHLITTVGTMHTVLSANAVRALGCNVLGLLRADVIEKFAGDGTLIDSECDHSSGCCSIRTG